MSYLSSLIKIGKLKGAQPRARFTKVSSNSISSGTTHIEGLAATAFVDKVGSWREGIPPQEPL
jgi:hypothetical protein